VQPKTISAHLFFFLPRRPKWHLAHQATPAHPGVFSHLGPRAAFVLAGAAAPLAVVSCPPVRVRSRNNAPPGRLLFPHTNSMPRRLPSPYYSSKPMELSSTEPSPDYSSTASLTPSLPYKSRPRAPSPHHRPIPHIGSLHLHPYCTPIELGPQTLCLAVAWPNRAAPAPTNVAVRFPSVPSFSRCFCGELPPFVAAARYASVSAPPRPGHESTVDQLE
jgi:hypothetical protein